MNLWAGCGPQPTGAKFKRDFIITPTAKSLDAPSSDLYIEERAPSCDQTGYVKRTDFAKLVANTRTFSLQSGPYYTYNFSFSKRMEDVHSWYQQPGEGKLHKLNGDNFNAVVRETTFSLPHDGTIHVEMRTEPDDIPHKG